MPIIEGEEVVVRGHEFKDGIWKAKTLFEAQHFFSV